MTPNNWLDSGPEPWLDWLRGLEEPPKEHIAPTQPSETALTRRNEEIKFGIEIWENEGGLIRSEDPPIRHRLTFEATSPQAVGGSP